jgi:hypothetical protein
MGSRNRFIKRKPTKKKVVKPARTRAQNRRSSSGAAVAKTTKTPAKPALKPIPASKRPKDMQAGKVYGDAGQPKAPKLPPKPTPSKPKPAPSKPKPSPAKPKPAPSKPKPAAKPAAKPKSKPRSWLKDNYKPGVKGIKSSRLSAALSNLKVKDYKKKK